jgi:putative ABC transport system permease protein
VWVRCVLALIGAALIASATVHADDTLPSVLISRQLSEGEHLSVGDVIRLSASDNGSNVRQFRIAGIYEPTPDPARLGAVIREVQLHLPDLLGLTREPSAPSGSEYVQTINVALVDPNDADAFSRDVRARMPGIDAQPASGAAESTGPFIVLRRFHLAIAIVTIVASTVFLLALTIMLVDERRAAVGVLRLIGLPIRRILLQLFLEGLLIAGCRFGVRPGTLAAVGRDHQPLLPVALRHDAGVRSRHAAGRGGVRGDRDPARCFGYRRRIVGAAAAQWPAAGPSMNAMGFAWRSLVRQPARASLGVLGVAAVGALLFDMLLLSQGLVISMRDLLERTGFDLRVTATDALPGQGPLIPNAVERTQAISQLPSVRSAVALRFANAVVLAGAPRGVYTTFRESPAPAPRIHGRFFAVAT